MTIKEFFTWKRSQWAQITLGVMIIAEPALIGVINDQRLMHPAWYLVGCLAYAQLNSIVFVELKNLRFGLWQTKENKRIVDDLIEHMSRFEREQAQAYMDHLASLRSLGREGEGWKRGNKD